jgi:hypothetical protein
MARLLPPAEFSAWLGAFLPGLAAREPAASAVAATAPSRSGGWSGVKMAASVGITRARNARATGW